MARGASSSRSGASSSRRTASTANQADNDDSLFIPPEDVQPGSDEDASTRNTVEPEVTTGASKGKERRRVSFEPRDEDDNGTPRRASVTSVSTGEGASERSGSRSRSQTPAGPVTAMSEAPDVLKSATFWKVSDSRMLSPADMVTHHNLALLLAETRENNRLMRSAMLVGGGGTSVKGSSSARTSITERDVSRKPGQKAHRDLIKQFAIDHKEFLQKIVAAYLEDGGVPRLSKSAQSFDVDRVKFQSIIDSIIKAEGDEAAAHADQLQYDEAQLDSIKQAFAQQALSDDDFALIFIDASKEHKAQQSTAKKGKKGKKAKDVGNEQEEEETAAPQEGSATGVRKSKKRSIVDDDEDEEADNAGQPRRTKRTKNSAGAPFVIDDNGDEDEEDDDQEMGDA